MVLESDLERGIGLQKYRHPTDVLKEQGRPIFSALESGDISYAVRLILEAIVELQRMRKEVSPEEPAFDAYNRIKNQWTLIFFAMLQSVGPMNALQRSLGINQHVIKAVEANYGIRVEDEFDVDAQDMGLKVYYNLGARVGSFHARPTQAARITDIFVGKGKFTISLLVQNGSFDIRVQETVRR